MRSKHFFSFAILIFFGFKITNCIAQKFYAEIGSGYGLSMASQNLTSKIDNGIAQTTNVLVKGSLGSGLNFGGNIGYKKNENIAAELGASYLIGHKFKGHYIKDMDFKENTIVSANMFRLTPGIRLTVGGGNTKLYGRIGATFRIFSKLKIKSELYDIKNNSTTEILWEYKGGFSLGMIATVGLIHKLNDKLCVFGELGMINQSWAPKKGKIIKYDIDGIDMTHRLNPYQKEVDFLDNYTTTNYNPSSTSSHRQQLKQYFPFSSIGINIGIHYSFVKKETFEK